MRKKCLTIVLLTLIASPISAEEENYRVYGELGFESVSEDRFLSVRPGFDWIEEVNTVGCVEQPCFTDLRLSAHVPLRLIIDDNPPEQDGLIRQQDWDQPSDFAKVLKRLQFGQPYETVHISVGELSFITVGNGTIVSDYVNNIQLNTFQPGVRGNINTAFGGFELMVDNAFSPSVVGGRAFVRPFGFDDVESWWQEIELGVSMMSDFDAPLVLGGDGPRTVDGYEAPSVEAAQQRSVAGVDAVLILERENFDLLPYVDLNFSNGVGFHFGSNVTLKFESFSVWTQLEGQVFASGYIPQYFGALYDIERYQFTGWAQNVAAPKSRFLTDTGNGNGVRVGLGTRVLEKVALEVDWSTRNIDQTDTLSLRLNITPIDRISIGAFYYKNGVNSEDLLDPDGSVIVSEARVQVFGPLYVLGRFDQKYRLGDDGTYATTTDYLAGIGAQYAW